MEGEDEVFSVRSQIRIGDRNARIRGRLTAIGGFAKPLPEDVYRASTVFDLEYADG